MTESLETPVADIPPLADAPTRLRPSYERSLCRTPSPLRSREPTTADAASFPPVDAASGGVEPYRI
jgi:hypothetical protein